MCRLGRIDIDLRREFEASSESARLALSAMNSGPIAGGVFDLALATEDQRRTFDRYIDLLRRNSGAMVFSSVPRSQRFHLVIQPAQPALEPVGGFDQGGAQMPVAGSD